MKSEEEEEKTATEFHTWPFGNQVDLQEGEGEKKERKEDIEKREEIEREEGRGGEIKRGG